MTIELNGQIISAFISAFAVCVGVLLTYLNNRKTNLQLRKFKYIDTITSRRIIWIESLREQCANVLTQLAYFQTICPKEAPREELEKRTEAITHDLYKLSLMVNPKTDRRLLKRLLRLRVFVTLDARQAALGFIAIERIRHEIQLMLKREWDKVRAESSI